MRAERPDGTNRRSWRARVLIVLVTLLTLSLCHSVTLSLHHSAYAASPLGAAQRAFQVQGAHYGTLPDDDAAVLRVRTLFRKLVRVAGAAPSANLTLYVLATPKVIAQRSAQGIIVVSLGLLDLVRTTEDALAFVLGHEIAHQVRGHESLLASLGLQMAPTESATAALTPEQIRAIQAMELDADGIGVLYASLAGYRARAALVVIPEIAAALGPDPFHPDPQRRAREIRSQIAKVLDHHEVYLLGLAYLAMERLEGAARIFEEFQSLYPSRELFLNLGVAYHKMALRYAPDDGLQRSILIDPRSRIRATLKGPDTAIHPLAAQYLEQATEAYKRAVAMDPDDPVAHNNLGMAFLDVGQFEYALGEFRAALQRDGGFVPAHNNRGIAYTKLEDLKRAEADLLEAVRRDPQYAPAFQNLAVVYQRMGNAAEQRKAVEAIERLARARRPPAVPAGRLAIGGIQPGMRGEEVERLLAGPASRQFEIPLSVTPGDELLLRIHGPRGLAVAVEKGVISAVGVVERGVARLPNGVDVATPAEQLRQAFGTPARMEAVCEASLWAYPDRGLVALIANGRVNSLWAVAP